MKRIELLKKTGICFTALALSAAVTLSAPATMAFAGDPGDPQIVNSEDGNQESASQNSKLKSANPKSADGQNEDPTVGGSSSGGGESGEGGSSGSGNTSGTGDSSSGAGNSGSSGSGNGTTTENGGSGETGSSGTGNTQNSGSSNTGSNTDGQTTIPVDPGDLGDGAGAGTQDPTQTTQPVTPQPTYVPTVPVDVPSVPQTRKKDGTLQEKKTQLNPGEVPTGYQDALGYTGTNDQLIAQQNIVSGLSILGNDFRFYTVDKDLAFSPIVQGIHEEMKSASRQVGVLNENDAMYVLSEEKDGWLYVESGNVRGFIKSTAVLRDDAALIILDDLQAKLDALSDLSGNEAPAADTILQFADETIPAAENTAYTYKRCTTKSTVVDKKYAVAETDTPVLEAKSDSAREVGLLKQGDLCYVIMQVDDHWAFVESGNVRGFIPLANVTTGKAGKKIVQKNGEAQMGKAEELMDPSENQALYYSFNSVQDGVAYSTIRSEIVEIAAECIGNPYVWGGESLTYGADCSGFVKTLYSMFGFSIPRVADAQSRFGTQIPIEDAAPGDLIFFAENGYVYHVAMYAGDGMTIEAYSEDRGIIATDIGNRNAVWATRIIED
ncbi:MAG: NlpC/P60 family protein [Eubacteriales bacterium]|nr:NlpC/P60 family protein [Eubacteriales bacterium]